MAKTTRAIAPTGNRIQTLHELFARPTVLQQIKRAAPQHLTPDRITRIAMTSIQRTPELAKCTPESLLGAVLTCTQLGLEPDAASGRAFLIPYKDQATLIIGYRGLMELARRSGELAGSPYARCVYEKDEYEFEHGLTPKLTHKPCPTPERGALVAVYAVAHFKDGGPPAYEWMWKHEVDAVRQGSRAGNSGPWVSHYPEMARKTVMRLLCKWLPMSAELQTAVTIDDQAERGEAQSLEIIDIAGEAESSPPRHVEDLAPKPAPEPPPPSPAVKAKKDGNGPAGGLLPDDHGIPGDGFTGDPK